MGLGHIIYTDALRTLPVANNKKPSEIGDLWAQVPGQQSSRIVDLWLRSVIKSQFFSSSCTAVSGQPYPRAGLPLS